MYVSVVIGSNKIEPIFLHVSNTLQQELNYLSDLLQIDIKYLNIDYEDGNEEKCGVTLSSSADCYLFGIPLDKIDNIFGDYVHNYEFQLRDLKICSKNYNDYSIQYQDNAKIAIFNNSNMLEIIDMINESLMC